MSTYGTAEAQQPQKVLVEFVSANPTGPMHVGHARNAAYGDALARMLAARGHAVEREFYVNDAGSQVRKFGESVSAVARGEAPPEDGYHGDYVADLAAAIPGARERDPTDVGRAAVEQMLEKTQEALAAFRVERFDHWTFESELYAGHPSLVESTIATLTEAGRTYTERRRPLAADDRVRRRQGSRADPVQRRAHLLRLRHRLPPEPP